MPSAASHSLFLQCRLAPTGFVLPQEFGVSYKRVSGQPAQILFGCYHLGGGAVIHAGEWLAAVRMHFKDPARFHVSCSRW